MKETADKKPQVEKHPVTLPSPVQKGDTIGLVAPAGPLISKENFAAGVKIIEDKGFKLKFNRKLLNRKGYLAGSDQERADEFNRLWADPDVKAIVAARGGYGSLRMIDLLDMDLIRKNPKIFIGFSDVTVLLNVIHKKTGLVTFHGPVVTTLANIDRRSRTSFFNVLTGKIPGRIKPAKIKVLNEGAAKGFLFGGNLTTLVHTLGTPYEIDWNNTIIFIEDTGETPYRLDRLLTHLYQAERLQKLKGLILGTFTDATGKENQLMRKTILARITELLNNTDIPVWWNFPTGHGRRNITMPIGLEVEMNSLSGELNVGCSRAPV